MRKQELIHKVAERAQVSGKTADLVVKALFEELGDCMARNDTIQIPHFGTFAVVEKKARQGKNPRTGEKIVIPAHRAAKFRAGKGLREKLEE